ncbi:MAG: CTP-dependent riboflavin kinase [Thaumarchaeota archaeon]|nr:CTP-dependent riboflavin kinase [Nitrososphaerota archaeon]
MEQLSPVLMSELFELVKLKAHLNFVEISTEEMAARTGQSQQAASQHLQKLEKLGLVERRRTGLRFAVKLTPKGFGIVNSQYAQLKAAVEGKSDEVTFRGKLFQGLGEGAYYIGLEGYKRQFSKVLGFDAFPGTLNLKLESPIQMEQKRELRSREGLKIEGFENGKRTYGGARCYRGNVNGKYPAAVLVIDRTHYDDSVMEIISPVNFRKELGLKNGDEVTFTVSD